MTDNPIMFNCGAALAAAEQAAEVYPSCTCSFVHDQHSHSRCAKLIFILTLPTYVNVIVCVSECT